MKRVDVEGITYNIIQYEVQWGSEFRANQFFAVDQNSSGLRYHDIQFNSLLTNKQYSFCCSDELDAFISRSINSVITISEMHDFNDNNESY